MKTTVLVGAIAVLSAAVQAGFTRAVDGVTYTVTHLDADGSELPVEFGPAINATALAARREQRRKALRTDACPVKQRTLRTDNWCGAANINPPGGGHWTSVSGAWTVPKITMRPGQNASDTEEPNIELVQFVGIGGIHSNSSYCSSGGLIQGGTGSKFNPKGVQENYAWFEFLPGPILPFKMNVSTSDRMSGLINLDSPTAGNVTIKNLTTGQSMNFYFTNGPQPVCGDSAEWIVEDVHSRYWDKLVPFPDFTDSSFSDCEAITSRGRSAGPGNINLQLTQNGRTLCNSKIVGSNVYVSSGR